MILSAGGAKVLTGFNYYCYYAYGSYCYYYTFYGY